MVDRRRGQGRRREQDRVAVGSRAGDRGHAERRARARRFSITNVWPSVCDNRCDVERATMSMALPAETGTITRTCLEGQPCAWPCP